MVTVAVEFKDSEQETVQAKFSRVPCQGEQVIVEFKRYEVLEVAHVDGGDTAILEVKPVNTKARVFKTSDRKKTWR